MQKDRAEGPGLRSQKKNELKQGGRFDWRDEGLTTGWGAPLW